KPIELHNARDSAVEVTETFTVQLLGSTTAVYGGQSATGTILDDDQHITPCSPRSNIRISTVRTGTYQLTVTVTAGYGTLQKLSFGSAAHAMTNATVETIGPSGLIQSFGVFSPPAGVIQQKFVVRRL